MGSWISIEDFEDFGYADKEKKLRVNLERKTSFCNIIQYKSPREIYKLANSFYVGKYHTHNPNKKVDMQDAAYFYKQSYDKLLKYVQTLDIQYESDY